MMLDNDHTFRASTRLHEESDDRTNTSQEAGREAGGAVGPWGNGAGWPDTISVC